MRCSKNTQTQPWREEPVLKDSYKSNTLLGLKNQRLKSSLQVPRKSQRTPGEGGDGPESSGSFQVCCEPHLAQSRLFQVCREPTSLPWHTVGSQKRSTAAGLLSKSQGKPSGNRHSGCAEPNAASQKHVLLFLFTLTHSKITNAQGQKTEDAHHYKSPGSGYQCRGKGLWLGRGPPTGLIDSTA